MKLFFKIFLGVFSLIAIQSLHSNNLDSLHRLIENEFSKDTVAMNKLVDIFNANIKHLTFEELEKFKSHAKSDIMTENYHLYLGGYHYIREEYEKALDNYLIVNESREKRGRSPFRNQVIWTICTLLQRLDKQAEFEDFTKHLFDIFEGSDYMYGYIYGIKGYNRYLYLDNDNAIKNYKLASDYFIKADSLELAANANYFIVMMYNSIKDTINIGKYMEKTIDLLENTKITDIQQYYHILITYSQYLDMIGNQAKSEEIKKKAIIFKKAHSGNELSDNDKLVLIPYIDDINDVDELKDNITKLKSFKIEGVTEHQIQAIKLKRNLVKYLKFYVSNNKIEDLIPYTQDLDSVNKVIDSMYSHSKRTYFKEQYSKEFARYDAEILKRDKEIAIQDLRLAENLRILEEQKAKDAIKGRELSERQLELSEIKNVNNELMLNNANQDKEIAELAIEKAKKNILIVSSVSLLFLIFLIVLLMQNRKQKILNSKLVEKEDQLKTINNEMAIKNDQLLKSVAFKDKLLSVISHDLQTPVLSMSMIAKKQNGNTPSFAELKKQNSIYKDLSNELKILLHNLLKWIKHQKQSINIEKSEINIYDLVTEVEIMSRESASARNMKIINQVNKAHKIFADRNMIATVLRNFMSNSIKYANDNSDIIIRSIDDEEMLKIEVIDESNGITDSKLNHIFDKQALNGIQNGNGLGLKICKEFIEMNEGIIFANSEVGKGSIFGFFIERSNIKADNEFQKSRD